VRGVAGADIFAPFIERPDRAAVLLDFDGTLAPIVDDPASARPSPGAAEVLPVLIERFALVAVLSGRPVSFIQPLLPPGMVISGLYGLEIVADGRRADRPGAGAWREAVADVASLSVDRGPEGMVVEPKGLSLTLHYRLRPEIESEVQEWARQQGARSGLVVRPAKMSVELHPPIEADKGTAVESLVDLQRVDAVCYAGDDVGDLPAFEALGRLAARGTHVARVAVGGPEAPPALVEAADVVVDGPDGLVGLLRELAGLPARD